MPIPAILVKNLLVVYNNYGTVNVDIIARTAEFSGTFFSPSAKTDQDLQSYTWTVLQLYN